MQAIAINALNSIKLYFSSKSFLDHQNTAASSAAHNNTHIKNNRSKQDPKINGNKITRINIKTKKP